MTVETSPKAALQEVPGWENASWQAMDGGITNRGWVVEANGLKGLLKIDERLRGVPFVDRLQEARIQDTAAARSIANRVLFASETIILTEFVEGTVWSPKYFDVDDNLTRLARALKLVHSLPLTGRRFDAIAAAEKYSENIGDADPLIAKRHMETIRTTPAPEHVCCCHNDLVAENIIEADGVKFLDWEYAADNDPLFDLAIVVAHHGLSIRQTSILLDAYFDGDGARWQTQLGKQVRLYDALRWLWRAVRT